MMRKQTAFYLHTMAATKDRRNWAPGLDMDRLGLDLLSVWSPYEGVLSFNSSSFLVSVNWRCDGVSQ